MKKGYLSQYFSGVAAKRLSAVEADTNASNQHEFNGDQALRNILGEPSGKERYPAQFLYFTDCDEDVVTDTGFLTWYDSRQKARLDRNVMRWEYRLYFPTNQVSQCASEGDLLVLAVRQSGQTARPELLAIVAEANSTIEKQLLWLFGLDQQREHLGFSVRSELETDQDRLGFAANTILEKIGIEPEEQAVNYLDEMLAKFGGVFPKTIEFSKYARGTLRDISSINNADEALLLWMEREEILFRTLERHLLAERLQNLQEARKIDPDAFIQLTMSFIQRRKSRAGSALENHMEQIFTDRGLSYSRTKVTENNLKPDFILPSIANYRDSSFPSTRLTMLAAKTTCKDRWRQVLNEASRIPGKHLLTLEPSISENQTTEMRDERVQLVVPAGIHDTFSQNQRAWLLSVESFLDVVNLRQYQ